MISPKKFIFESNAYFLHHFSGTNQTCVEQFFYFTRACFMPEVVILSSRMECLFINIFRVNKHLLLSSRIFYTKIHNQPYVFSENDCKLFLILRFELFSCFTFVATVNRLFYSKKLHMKFDASIHVRK